MPAFDFSNYTYSGLLSILATLLGMAYPLIIECISKIDDKYDSTILMARFLKEKRYGFFVFLLSLNVAVGIGMPFVLSIFSDNRNDVLLLIQTVLMTLLVAQTFILIRLILTYYNANALCEYLEHKQTSDWNKITNNLPIVHALYDIARYAAKRSDRTLYVKSGASLYATLYILQEKTNPDQNILPKVVQYPDELKQILSDFCDFVRYNKNTYPFVRNEVDVLAPLINSLHPAPFGSWEYRYIWRNIFYASQDGDEEWFINKYWVWMEQNYRFQIKYKKWAYQDTGKEIADDYKLHSSMACAMMLHMNHYKIVEDAVFFMNTSSEPYQLVPNSFTQIFEQGRMLYELKFGIMNVGQLSARFMMPGIYCGIGADGEIYKKGIRFLALMMIRLYSVNDYNVTYSDPLSLPSFRKTVAELKADKLLCEDIRIAVNEWFSNAVFGKFRKFRKCSHTDVNGLLWKYQNECERILNYRAKDFTPSKAKLDSFLECFSQQEEALENWLPRFSDCCIDKFERRELSDSRSLSSQIPMAELTEWYDMDIGDVSEYIFAYLKGEVEQVFVEHFLMSVNRVDSKIKKEKFFKSLKKDWLCLDYICVVTGGFISKFIEDSDVKGLTKEGCSYNFKGLKIIECEIGCECAYILKRADLPFITFKPIARTQPWSAQRVFFSNFDGMRTNAVAEYNLNTVVNMVFNRKVQRVDAVIIS